MAIEQRFVVARYGSDVWPYKDALSNAQCETLAGALVVFAANARECEGAGAGSTALFVDEVEVLAFHGGRMWMTTLIDRSIVPHQERCNAGTAGAIAATLVDPEACPCWCHHYTSRGVDPAPKADQVGYAQVIVG